MAVRCDLDELTRASGDLVLPHPSGKLRCVACAHRCLIADGRRGVCQVRYRGPDGLRVPWGYTAGVAVDPIEKKPFFHVLPGSDALSFGMLGCDLQCDYCQNWFTSQTLRDEAASTTAHPVTAGELVETARRRGCRTVVSTYNEPLITAEWAHHVFSAARSAGLLTGFVSNGHGTPEVLEYLRPVTDLYKVDLKAFRPASYRRLGGRLEAVTETIRALHASGFWLEVVTLVVPGFNDDEGELAEMAAFLASVSPDVPWHVTAFHPDYRLTDRGATPARSLARARRAGEAAGLRHVYAGNLPGELDGAEDTRCPGCGTAVVRRFGYRILENRLDDGRCPTCATAIPGVWSPPSVRP